MDYGEKPQLSEDTTSQKVCNLTITWTHTATIALTYLTEAVLRHPEVQAKLQVD